MSIEQAKLFMERMAEDEAFMTKILELKSVSNVVQMASAQGYDFTEEDIKSAFAESCDQDSAVDGVSAGGLRWMDLTGAGIIRRWGEAIGQLEP